MFVWLVNYTFIFVLLALLIETYISLKPSLHRLFYLCEFNNTVSSELPRSISGQFSSLYLPLASQIPGKTLEN